MRMPDGSFVAGRRHPVGDRLPARAGPPGAPAICGRRRAASAWRTTRATRRAASVPHRLRALAVHHRRESRRAGRRARDRGGPRRGRGVSSAAPHLAAPPCAAPTSRRRARAAAETAFGGCCGPVLGGADAPTAERLMRSRYTAFVDRRCGAPVAIVAPADASRRHRHRPGSDLDRAADRGCRGRRRPTTTTESSSSAHRGDRARGQKRAREAARAQPVHQTPWPMAVPRR